MGSNQTTVEVHIGEYNFFNNFLVIDYFTIDYSSLLTKIFIFQVTLGCCNDLVAIFFRSCIDVFN